jgi:N-acetylglucosamine-6-sulfatase
MRHQRIGFGVLWAIVLSLAAVHGTARVQRSQAPTGSTRRPNIVFILADDFSWNLVPFMPHVLKMQRDGVTFANYFVTDSLCCPSRSSIFTGRFPHDTGVFRNIGKDGGYGAFENLGNEKVTFATALSAAGYRTSMSGKYLNGYLPEKHSADPGWSSWAVGGHAYPNFNYDLNQDGKIVHYTRKPADYLTDVVSGLGVKFIKQAGDTPFLIEIATYAPHAPYTPAPRDADAFPDLKAPRTAAFNAAPDGDAVKWLFTHSALTDADLIQIDRVFRRRAQSVQAIDKMIGDLEAAVAAAGKLQATYFVFSSDNGLHMGEHRLMPGKMTAFDIDIHVPLIVTGPGISAGRTVDAVTENIDLAPTFAELGGAHMPGNVDGLSLVPLLRSQNVAEWRTAALVEHRGPLNKNADKGDPDSPEPRSGNPPSYEAIRTVTGVYVEYIDGEKEYHDFASDPQELRNTFKSLPSQEQAALHAKLAALKTCHDAKGCLAAEHRTPSPAR